MASGWRDPESVGMGIIMACFGLSMLAVIVGAVVWSLR